MTNYDEIFEKNFDKIRSQQAYVEEEDASRKSCIDERIISLVNLINENTKYFTTSSCSGRFIAYAQVRLLANLNEVGSLINISQNSVKRMV